MVAALTLPSLIQKYQYQAYVTQLQKTLNTMSESIKFAMAKDEVNVFTQTDLYNQFTGDNYGDFVTNCLFDPKKAEMMVKKYFKIVKFVPRLHPDYKAKYNPNEYYSLSDARAFVDPYMNGNWIGLIKFQDGSEVHIRFVEERDADNNEYMVLRIDVNGKDKNPNQWGRDVFELAVNKNGAIKPRNIDFICETGVCDWSDYMGCDTNERNTGFACFDRLISDGWKMKY